MRLRHLMGTAAFGHKRSLPKAIRNERLQIRWWSFERITAAHNDLFVSYGGIVVSKRKQLMGAEFVAS